LLLRTLRFPEIKTCEPTEELSGCVLQPVEPSSGIFLTKVLKKIVYKNIKIMHTVFVNIKEKRV
jgi:hypothetical protein